MTDKTRDQLLVAIGRAVSALMYDSQAANSRTHKKLEETVDEAEKENDNDKLR